MLALKEYEVTEEVLFEVVARRIQPSILFIGRLDQSKGTLIIGALEIVFVWNIETDFLLDKMKRETNKLEVLNLIDSLRKYDYYEQI